MMNSQPQKESNTNSGPIQKKHKTDPQKSKESTNPFTEAFENIQLKNINPFTQAFGDFQPNPNSSPTSPPIQRKGNQASAAQNPVIQRQNALPQPLKGNMEAMSGIDLSDVTVHHNSSKPAQLQAHAYAQGADIYLASGQDKHLAHEAWHTVQQKQGRVKPTIQLKGKVNINDDEGLEQEADIMGQKAIQGKFQSPVQKQPLKQIRSIATIQKKKKGKTPFKNGYQRLFKHPNWQEQAKTFEKTLGINLYGRPDVQEAAANALRKLKEVLVKYYSGLPKYKNNEDAIKRKAFLRNDKTSAGQIGQNASDQDLNNILTGQGNLRETMTAIYNGAFYRGDRKNQNGEPLDYFDRIFQGNKERKEGDVKGDKGLEQLDFKRIFQNHMFEKKEDVVAFAAQLDLDEAALLEQYKFYHSGTGRLNKAYARDPYKVPNMTRKADRFFNYTREMRSAQKAREARPDEERLQNQKELMHYPNIGAGYSPAEINHLQQNMQGNKLPWVEGKAYWKMKNDSKWVKKIRDKLGMPVIAGPSATTARLLNTFKWLKVPDTDIMKFRLAIIAWMLTSEDHSLYEIMRGAHMVGVKGADETLADAVALYTNLEPLTIAELRRLGGTGNRFPHEIIYEQEAFKDDYDPKKPNLYNKRLSSPGQEEANEALETYNALGTQNPLVISREDMLRDQWMRQNNLDANTIRSTLSLAHAIALRGYTGGLYPFLNAVMSHSPIVAREIIKQKLHKVVSYLVKYSFFYKKENSTEGLSDQEKESFKSLKAYPEEWVEILRPIFSDIWQGDASNPNKTPAERKTARKAMNPQINRMVKPFYEELKVHAMMTQDALQKLPAANNTVVWRGAGKIRPERKGKTITFGKFGSTSREEGIAKDFALKYKKKRGFTPVLYKLNLKGQGAKDINAFSKYFASDRDEQEVLLMPGTKFKVDRTFYQGAGQERILVIEATEIVSNQNAPTAQTTQVGNDADHTPDNVGNVENDGVDSMTGDLGYTEDDGTNSMGFMENIEEKDDWAGMDT